MMFIFFIVVAIALAGWHYFQLRKKLAKIESELAEALAGEWGAKLSLQKLQNECNRETNEFRGEMYYYMNEMYYYMNYVGDVEKISDIYLQELERFCLDGNYWLKVVLKINSRAASMYDDNPRESLDQRKKRAFVEHVSSLK